MDPGSSPYDVRRVKGTVKRDKEATTFPSLLSSIILTIIIILLGVAIYYQTDRINYLRNLKRDLQARYRNTMSEVYLLRRERDRLRFILTATQKESFSEELKIDFHLIFPHSHQVIVPATPLRANKKRGGKAPSSKISS